jgi:hypothetical protein
MKGVSELVEKGVVMAEIDVRHRMEKMKRLLLLWTIVDPS